MNYIDLANLLFEEARKLKLQPKWLTDYGLFSIESNHKVYFIYYSYSLFNSHLSSRLSRDKHITRTILEENKLPNIPYTLAKTKEEVLAFLAIHKTIIAKPNLSSHSENVYLIKNLHEIPAIPYNEYLLEQFIKGEELRYLVLQGKVIAVHRKYYKTPINNPDTVKRISYPQDQWNQDMVKLTLEITNTMHLNFAAVDFIIDKQGKAFVLEVNSAPGLWHFHYPEEGPAINVARMFLEATIATIQ